MNKEEDLLPWIHVKMLEKKVYPLMMNQKDQQKEHLN